MASLTLPHAVVEDGRESASYDIGSGQLTVRLPKKIPGQHFADLDLLTTLMASNKKEERDPKFTMTPKIQMMQESRESHAADSHDGRCFVEATGTAFGLESLT